MLHRFKYVTLFFVLLIVVGCAGAPKLTVVSPAGDRIPNPFYTAGTTDGSQMRFTWYYVKHQGIRDLDQTVQLSPIHLDRNKVHYIERKTTHKFKMVLRVFNPNLEEYTIYATNRIEYTDGKVVQHRFDVGKSFLEFRLWEFPFPYNDRVKRYESFFEIQSGDRLLLRTKRFKYSVN